MRLKTVTYTSLASLDLDATALEDIHRTARDLNALEGITGLLIFNGSRFLQVIEGSDPAIDDLIARLRRDRRHSGLEIRDERHVERPNFPGWSMELVRVSASYFEAHDSVQSVIPSGVDEGLRAHLSNMVEAVSGTVRFDR